MKIDRELQRRILEKLAECYPSGSLDLANELSLHESDADSLLANIQYLDDHELVKSAYRMTQYTGGHHAWHNVGQTTITAKGLDFIADDGGLSAILNTITVRLDATQWAELLASKVEALPNVSADERSALAKALRSLPAKAIEKVSSKLLDWAVDHAADALPLLRMLLGPALG